MTSDILPTSAVLILTILTTTARFENIRWIKARTQGFKGSNKYFGFFVDQTGFLSMVFSCGFIAAYFYDFGLKSTLSLIGILFLAGSLTCVIIGTLFKGDNPLVWLICTIALWPLSIMLSFHVSWFGLVKNFLK